MMRAILGGTFDPVHYGHLRPAQSASAELHADQLLLLPNRQPPHRPQPEASVTQRLHMLQLASNESDDICVDDWELQQARPSYMVQTLAELKQRWPNDTLVLLMGDDALASLNSWYQWTGLLDHAHLAILRRPDQAPQLPLAVQDFVNTHRVESSQQLLQQDAGLIYFTHSPLCPQSATLIRDQIKASEAWQHLLPTAVAEYIIQQGLYR